MDYKNNIFILRNIHKSNDEELINYYKKIEILIRLFTILIIAIKNIFHIYI